MFSGKVKVPIDGFRYDLTISWRAFFSDIGIAHLGPRVFGPIGSLEFHYQTFNISLFIRKYALQDCEGLLKELLV